MHFTDAPDGDFGPVTLFDKSLRLGEVGSASPLRNRNSELYQLLGIDNFFEVGRGSGSYFAASEGFGPPSPSLYPTFIPNLDSWRR